MAVNKVPESAKLILKVENGVNSAGKTIVRQHSFTGLKPDAADDAVFAVGQAIAGLQSHNVVAIARQDENKLVNA